MNIFFCSTPYQILLACLIRRELARQSVSDMFIMNQFLGADEMAVRLQRLGLFRRIEVLDTYHFTQLFYTRNTTLRRMRTIRHNLTYRRTISRYLSLGSSYYTDLYFSGEPMIIQLALKELYRRNSGLAVHMFEDGSGSYGDAMIRKSLWKRGFNSMTGSRFLNSPYSDFLSLQPSLVTGNRPAPVRRIPKLDKGDEDLRLDLNYLFEYTDGDDGIVQDVVFFQQPLDYYPGLNEAVRDAANAILPEDAIIKLHPRSREDIYSERNVYARSDSPWEIIALNSSLSNKILVSFFSTALTTSKVLFAEEPYIVFLFDVPELKSRWDLPASLREFSVRFKESYSDPSRVQVPKSICEARQCIQLARSRIKSG